MLARRFSNMHRVDYPALTYLLRAWRNSAVDLTLPDFDVQVLCKTVAIKEKAVLLEKRILIFFFFVFVCHCD